MGLAGAAGAGLLAATGGAAAGGLGGLFGSTGAAAGAGGTAAATGGAGATAGILGAEAAGAGGASIGMLGADAATGSLLYPGTASAASASGFGAGAAAPTAQSMMFTTPSVTGGPLSGALSGTTLDYGTTAGLAEANTAAAGQPGMLAQAGSALKTGMKAANTYGTVNKAMGGDQAPMQAPAGRPVFQGEAPQISSSLGDMGGPAPNQNAVLAAIARRRQRGY